MTGSDVLLWTNYSDYTASRGASWAMPTIGIVGLGLGISLRDPYVAVGIGVFGLFQVPAWIVPRRKIRISGSEARISAQPIWGNYALWFPFVFGVAFVAFLLDPRRREGGVRILFALLLMPVIVVWILVLAYRNRGPLILSSSCVSLGPGAQFDLATCKASVISDASGRPRILLARSDETLDRLALDAPTFGVDFNTLMSVIVQLQKWHVDGKQTSPAMIKAMLTLHPDYPYPIRGNSVELAIPSPEPEAA